MLNNFFFGEKNETFPPPEKNETFICRKMFVDPGRPQMTVRRMRIAGWVRKSINTYSKM